MNVLGQCGPLVGTRLFPAADGPWYVKGMLVCAGFMAGVAGLAGGLRGWLGALNRRAQGKEGQRLGEGMDGDGDEDVEMVELGEDREEEEDDDYGGDGEELMGRGGGRGRKSTKKGGGEGRFGYML